jgi:hypothetical protein
MKEEDTNTGFFHRFINYRRRTNSIHCMEKDGRFLDEVKDIKEGIFNHFQEQFPKMKTRHPSI